MRNFVNKVWNSARFVLMNLAPGKTYSLDSLSHRGLELSDKWILSRYQGALKTSKERLDAYDPAGAAGALYVFLWDEFCAWYIELAKVRLTGIDGEEKEAARAILVSVLAGTLKALHPLMPFVTEELSLALKPWSGEKADFLLQAGYTEPGYDWSNPEAEAEMRHIMGAVTAIRSLRAQLNVPVDLSIKAVAQGKLDERHHVYVSRLAKLESITSYTSRPPQSATAVADGVTFFIPLAGVVDFAKEK